MERLSVIVNGLVFTLMPTKLVMILTNVKYCAEILWLTCPMLTDQVTAIIVIQTLLVPTLMAPSHAPVK